MHLVQQTRKMSERSKTLSLHKATVTDGMLFCAGMFAALNPGFRSLATLKVNL